MLLCVGLVLILGAGVVGARYLQDSNAKGDRAPSWGELSATITRLPSRHSMASMALPAGSRESHFTPVVLA